MLTVDGPVIAQIEIPKSDKWNIVHSPQLEYHPGIHTMIVLLKDNKIEKDWIGFK
jgi:hypothetical protein